MAKAGAFGGGGVNVRRAKLIAKDRDLFAGKGNGAERRQQG